MELECRHKDLVVRVLEVDDLVVEHVLVDLVVQVFWIVRAVVLEVLEHLVEVDLLWMVVKVLGVLVVVVLHVRLQLVLPVELASCSDSVCGPPVELEYPLASSSSQWRLQCQSFDLLVVLEEVDVSVVLVQASPLFRCLPLLFQLMPLPVYRHSDVYAIVQAVSSEDVSFSVLLPLLPVAPERLLVVL